MVCDSCSRCPIGAHFAFRTASELKVKHAQRDVPTMSAYDASRFNLGIGIDMSSGTAQESADRALSSVARKLDKGLSVESTVNELIAEATDPLNLATIFYGSSVPHHIYQLGLILKSSPA